MSGKSDSLENSILALLLNGTAISQIADNAASSAFTDLWASLHTADPTDSGTQGSNEATYTNYTRIATTRSTDGWSVSGNTAYPYSSIDFPTASTATSTETITHFALGPTSASTAGVIYYLGTVTPNINVSGNVQPKLSTSGTITED